MNDSIWALSLGVPRQEKSIFTDYASDAIAPKPVTNNTCKCDNCSYNKINRFSDDRERML